MKNIPYCFSAPFYRLVPLSLLVALAGCPGNLDEMAAEEAVDTGEVAVNEAALLTSSADDAMANSKAAEAAANNEARSPARYQPPGCATVTRNGTVVTHVLNDCTGPRGLVHLTGTVVTTFTDAADGLHIQVQSTGLRANNAVMDVMASGVLSDEDGGKKKLVMNAQGTGTGARGNQFTRTGQYTALGDPASNCLQLDGTWQLSVGNANRSTNISGLQLCRNTCPQTGRIVHTGFRGRTLTVTFDGSSEAKWSSSRGNDGTVTLNCGG